MLASWSHPAPAAPLSWDPGGGSGWGLGARLTGTSERPGWWPFSGSCVTAAPSSVLRQPEQVERERRVSNAGDGPMAPGGRGGSPEEGVGQLDNKQQGFSLSTPPFPVCFRSPSCSPSWGTTSTSRTSPASGSPPTLWSAPLGGLSCRAWSRGRPTPSTPSPHSSWPQRWRAWGPRPGCSHCRSQTQESQQGEGARHGRVWGDGGPEGIMGNEARAAWGRREACP